MRRPRTPKPARAPKPRALIWRSCASFERLRTTSPGTRASASDSWISGPAARSASASTTLMA
jgi:hypothetical protein